MNDYESTYQRCQVLLTEITVEKRQRAEHAAKAKKVIDRISMEDVELLSEISPGIRDVKQLTEKDLIDDASGAANLLQRVCDDLNNWAKSVLSQYEGSL